MDKKGITVYLAIVFILGYVLMPVLLYAHLIVFENRNMLTNIVFLAIMWIPAFAAAISSALVPRPELKRAPVWPLPAGKAVRIALVVPALFLVVHLITALRWTPIDLRVGTLMNQINGLIQQPLPEAAAAVAPGVALVAGLALSIALGATVFAALALGSEFGWRGYLLPRMMPLGRLPAYVITGLLWGAWFLPLVYGYCLRMEQMETLGGLVLRFLALMVLLSVVLGEITRRSRHLGLAAVFAGAFAGQLQGIWRHMFPMTAAPWTGPVGIVALVVWLVVALVPALLIRGEARGNGACGACPDPEGG